MRRCGRRSRRRLRSLRQRRNQAAVRETACQRDVVAVLRQTTSAATPWAERVNYDQLLDGLSKGLGEAGCGASGEALETAEPAPMAACGSDAGAARRPLIERQEKR